MSDTMPTCPFCGEEMYVSEAYVTRWGGGCDNMECEFRPETHHLYNSREEALFQLCNQLGVAAAVDAERERCILLLRSNCDDCGDYDEPCEMCRKQIGAIRAGEPCENFILDSGATKCPRCKAKLNGSFQCSERCHVRHGIYADEPTYIISGAGE